VLFLISEAVFVGYVCWLHQWLCMWVLESTLYMCIVSIVCKEVSPRKNNVLFLYCTSKEENISIARSCLLILTMIYCNLKELWTVYFLLCVDCAHHSVRCQQLVLDVFMSDAHLCCSNVIFGLNIRWWICIVWKLRNIIHCLSGKICPEIGVYT